MAYQIQPAAEFQNLPLETLICAPLTGAVKAQAAASSATLQFIDSLMTVDPQTKARIPVSTTFSSKIALSVPAPTANDPQAVQQKVQDVEITLPFISILPIPNLLIDKVSSEFEFTVSQTYQESTKVDATASLEVGVQVPLKWLVNASLKGNITRASSTSTDVRRSGSLKVSVEAHQAPLPAGLEKVLNLFAQSISVTPKP